MFHLVFALFSILIFLLGGSNNNNSKSQYFLLQTQTNISLSNISLTSDGKYAIGNGIYSSTPLIEEAIYIWELPQTYDDNLNYIPLNPTYQRIDQWENSYLGGNLAISYDNNYVITHTQTRIEVAQIPDLTVIASLIIPPTASQRQSSWSFEGRSIAFVINDSELRGKSRLIVWDWIDNKNYEKVVDNVGFRIRSVNNQWLFWRYKSFMLCSQFLEICHEYRTDEPLDFVYPVKGGSRIIGGDRVENDIYQIIYWDLETDSYVETLGPIVNFGSIPVIPSQDGNYFSTSFNIFETSAWRGVIELEQFGGAHQIFTSDNRFLVGFDFENLLVFDVATGSLIDSLNLRGKFTDLVWSEIDLEYTQLKSISDDGKWAVMILGPAGALIPLENSGTFP